jgi:hypothetical protein
MLHRYAVGPPRRTYADCENLLKNELELLANRGVLHLGPDESLTGTPLEFRVRQLFEEAGFIVDPKLASTPESA